MANIGRVYKDSYTKGGQVYPLITLDIRTLTQRKKMTISVNKVKFPDGKVGGPIAQGKEEHPDYHVWANFSNRGESTPSVIVGNIKDAVSEGGLAYKRGNIFDPFVQKESIYFTLFAVNDEEKIDENHLYNVVAQPYRKMNNDSNNNGYATPAYDAGTTQNKTYDTRNDTVERVPNTEPIQVDEDEIPF